MLSGTFKKVPRWHFFEQSAQKAAHLLVFVRRRVIWKVTAGWVSLLFSVHPQPIKRHDWQIYSSSSSSPTPPRVLLSFTPPLCLLFIPSSFYLTRLGLTFVLEMTFQWCELFNIKPAATTKSQTQRTLFFLHLSSAKLKCTLYTWGLKSKISVSFFSQ